MAQLFSKNANSIPGKMAGGLLVKVFVIVFGIYYWFSPNYTDVGYQPEQPVAYSHQLHVDKLGLDCQYCHTSVEVSAHANVPATQTCMNCHSQVKTDSPKLMLVRESWINDVPVEWVRVHKLPDYVAFNHSAHVTVGVGCESCHGRVDGMEVVTQQQPLSMSWCLDCHRSPEEHLRDPSQVTTMGYDYPENYVADNIARIEAERIRPPENCSGCHY